MLHDLLGARPILSYIPMDERSFDAGAFYSAALQGQPLSLLGEGSTTGLHS